MGDVGILTFHCADNFGAMLQAYGLKTYLRQKNIAADIVPYEPPFMTGRHWWIPYIPSGNVRKILKSGWYGWQSNLRMGKKFFERRANMKRFREKYLSSKRGKKVFFDCQLKKLTYQYYILGSDQIWNPDITYRLRKAYFGGFNSKRKKKVIAYAASLGGASLSHKYDKEFSALLQYVDVISVRENKAVTYIQQFYRKKVYTVPDPVFLLGKEEWQKIEKSSDLEGYIFVYMTERNDKMIEYAKDLSIKKNLKIVKIKGGAEIDGENVLTDYVAGPAEFLGYIHNADYVVTNSFHGAAFSIIYQKKFVVFLHSRSGERISNILALHGLESRMYQEDGDTEIDCDVAWEQVRSDTRRNVGAAEEFLLKNIR